MDSRKLKTFMLSLLTVIAVIIGAFTVKETISRNYLSDEMISDAVELLEKSGIKVDASAIDRKIYENESVRYAELDKYSYYIWVAEHLGKSEKTDLRILPNGCEITLQNGNVACFDGNFSIRYNTDVEIPDAFSEISKKDFDVSAADGYLKSAQGNYYGSGEAVTSYEIGDVYYNFESGIYKIECIQTLNGRSLGDFSFDMYFLNGELVGAEGNWCFVCPTESYYSQTLDVVNILFKEREYFASLTEKAEKTVKAISRIYVIYENKDGSGFYFAPAFRIEYTDAEVRIYNALDGELYQSQ